MKTKYVLIGIIGLVVIGLLIGGHYTFRSPWKYRGNGPIRILHIDSYHEEWEWSLGQITGFKSYFNEINQDIILEEFYMDTKRNNSEAKKIQSSAEAIELIEKFNPDLIYATDDNAQEYVTSKFIDSDIPIVYSGVNAKIEDYGLENVRNIAGVLERYDVSGLVDFIHELYPDVSRFAVISDNASTGRRNMEYIKEVAGDIDAEFIAFDHVSNYEEYKAKVLDYQNSADVIILLGIATFISEDNGGENIPLGDVVEWTVKNSDIPEFSFRNHYVEAGILGAVGNSGEDNGLLAAKLAEDILIKGITPIELEAVPTKYSIQVINLARAKTLELEIQDAIVINSEVHWEFPWETTE